ncbi:phosphoserine phosphatase, putative [Coccidioides posadasii C735 delta SOWgp]|uniref:phosphoserine phosphatase n=2 Tax=Coccidioides posadasii TaxID=199306 RepID=A0A0J6EZT3_COCPO|nr:phosphoserine phosphatase, putative [Coccidioides posadasii C735 delta SOWgp]EER24392.1 phosphoserine phosphatase, putative [Coccidioides posadasii C735 delta SOWgp]KMM66096.1 phosphoserine phosphatase [Coccidioides posadasii RMSCC 3488]|eukprot:XP_003066537.1 phosphoserine phosphatase, putative [Coccidioides posadasii C735 delta SOWgp]
MASTPLPSREGRPVLRHSSLSGGSFILDHQQYKPSPSGPSGFSNLLRSTGNVLTAPLVLNGSLSQGKDARVKESGIVHSIFSNSLSSLPADTPKLVATIFYKASQPVHPHIHPDSSRQPHSLRDLPAPSVPEGSAPTQNVEELPREPPPQEPEPLDHLYGPYVSQLCLTNFLQIMEDLSTPYHRMSSSHRCLDSEDQPRVVEVTICPPPSPDYLSFDDMRKHEFIWRFEREWNVEVVLQQESVFRRHKRLAVFDMDSTLIKQEVIDEIARFIGVEKEVSEITARAMNGELDFSASLKARVSLLKGVPADVFEKLKSIITIAPGARELCRALKRLGFKMAVLSGGFQPLAEWLAKELSLDYAFANHLVSDDSTQTLSGTLSPNYPIIDATQKRNLLRTIAADNDIQISQTLAVGDGANDLLMLNEAGLGVAWRAKSKVQMEAPTRLNGESLVDILYLMGLSERDIKELIKE